MTDRAPRQSILLPLLLPLGSLAVIVLALWGFSRILLNTTHTAAVLVALVAAAGIMAIAAYVTRARAGGMALYSLVGGAAGVAMLAGGAALVVAPPHGDEGEGPPPVAIVAPVNAIADGFASDTYTVPADVAFDIEFDNQDPGVPHNVWIAVEEGGDVLFEGANVTGPVVTTYAIEDPLAEGSYFFYCQIHPATMTGTLEAEPGAGGGGEDGEGGGGGGTVVVASQLAFDTDTLELPADTPTTITFDNQDDVGTFGPHNIAIYENEAAATGGGTALFGGELVNGPATVPYDVPGLPAGELFFHCDVHPQMKGVVIVDGGGGDAGGGDAGGGDAEPDTG